VAVYPVAGAPAAGKSTVSRLVAECRPRCVLVDVDHSGHSMVVSGAALPSAEWPGELMEQLVAAREAASGIARA
jgi:dephospho-CoA kinase